MSVKRSRCLCYEAGFSTEVTSGAVGEFSVTKPVLLGSTTSATIVNLPGNQPCQEQIMKVFLPITDLKNYKEIKKKKKMVPQQTHLQIKNLGDRNVIRVDPCKNKTFCRIRLSPIMIALMFVPATNQNMYGLWGLVIKLATLIIVSMQISCI